MTHSLVSLLHGDAETRLRELPDETFNACVTSPPYFGLRRYGGAEIGHETTQDAYAARLVDVFREVRRVLRSDGSLWLVLGDSYSNDGKWGGSSNNNKNAGNTTGTEGFRMRRSTGLKPKDLIGVPWLIAFALRADGWHLREAIVWRKASCMPESVTDRCTVQHEYVFHLTKSAAYYHDWYGIAEPFQTDAKENYETRARATGRNRQGYSVARGGDRDKSGGYPQDAGLRNARSVWDVNPEPFEGQSCQGCRSYFTGAEYKRLPRLESDAGKGARICPCGDSDRWLSHFAVFPTRLVSRCLRASAPAGGCCGACGAPTRRVLEKKAPDPAWLAACGADASGGYDGMSRDGGKASGAQDASATKARILAGMARKETVGWIPTCGCGSEARSRPLVLDPFSGAGTTALCATRLNCDAVGIDLNEGYLRMSADRLLDKTAKCLDTDGARLPFASCEVSIA